MEYWSFIPDVVNTIIIAILFVFLGLIIGKLVEKFIYLIIQELEITTLLHKATDVRISFEKVIPPLVRMSIIFLGITKAFIVLGVEKLVFIIFVTLFLIFVVGILLLNLYNSIVNGIAGLSLKEKISQLKGKELRFDTLSGIIEHNTLTHLFLLTPEGDRYAIPYSILKRKCMTLL